MVRVAQRRMRKLCKTDRKEEKGYIKKKERKKKKTESITDVSVLFIDFTVPKDTAKHFHKVTLTLVVSYQQYSLIKGCLLSIVVYFPMS